MKKDAKKLKLNREILRQLSNDELNKVNGADTFLECTTSALTLTNPTVSKPGGRCPGVDDGSWWKFPEFPNIADKIKP
jgi:hypothetical protein